MINIIGVLLASVGGRKLVSVHYELYFSSKDDNYHIYAATVVVTLQQLVTDLVGWV